MTHDVVETSAADTLGPFDAALPGITPPPTAGIPTAEADHSVHGSGAVHGRFGGNLDSRSAARPYVVVYMSRGPQ